ncbi:MAG: SUMF1/EgtB/PvdO family nonheme iron enzyme [Roseiflexaceae bacterium]|nr:SUMF1/EgtB/PvdO family nonheme iron enzyme [Roseiflexaceae bacterium]
MTYYRIIASQALRSALTADLIAAGIGHLPLTEIYVERGVVPAQNSANAAPLPLADLARAPRVRLALEGRAGSGKSTAVRRLALACAAAVTGEPEGAAALLADWTPPAPLPVLIEAPTQIDAAPDPWSLIEAYLTAGGLAAFAGSVHQALLNGEALIIIDGVTPRSAPLVTQIVAAFPTNRYICTCRPHTSADVSPASLLQVHGFQLVHFAPLERSQVDSMVARLLTAINRRRIVRDPSPSRSGTIAEQIADLQGRLLIDDGLRTLTFEPLALAIAVVTDASGHMLPAARARVYQQVLATLWDNDDPPSTVLAPLALALQRMMYEDGRLGVLMHADVERLIRESVPDADDARIAAVIERAFEAGLLDRASEAPQPAYSMPQIGLRAFLAAHALAHADDFAAIMARLADRPAWRETLTLAVWQRMNTVLADSTQERGPNSPIPWHVLGLSEHAGKADDERLAKKKSSQRAAKPGPVLQRNADAPISRPEQAVLLAASCLEAVEAQRFPDVLHEVRQRLLAIIADPAIAVEDRVHAGLMLGRLGDPRFADLLPPLAQIDAGVFVYGTNDAPYSEEGPAQRIDLPAYHIGVYPVTNAEYARFLAARPGHPKPRYWYDPRFNNPSQPVVGVTWHDAVAYTTWLTRVLATDGRLPPGMVARLPLETEWEKAATWDPRARVKRRFPWGDQWVVGAANVAETRAGPDGRSRWATTPVGCFPSGVSPYGVHDLIGNIWEWTASSVEATPGRGAATGRRTGRLHLQSAPSGALSSEPRCHYILRGSSFNSTTAHARATYRGSHLPPDYWRYNIGFRIVIARPLAGE